MASRAPQHTGDSDPGVPPPPHPITLAIETSNPAAAAGGAGIAVRLADGIILERPLVEQKRHDDILLGTIDRLFLDAGLAPADLQRVAVSLGPGGYSATRVGVTTAKSLADALGIPVIGVPTALTLAAVNHRKLLVVLASKRRSAWCVNIVPSKDCAHWTLSGDPVLAGFDDLAALAADADAVIAADDAARALPSEITVLNPDFSARRVLLTSDHLDPSPAATVGPIYPRDPEAVSKWRALGRGGSTPKSA